MAVRERPGPRGWFAARRRRQALAERRHEVAARGAPDPNSEDGAHVPRSAAARAGDSLPPAAPVSWIRPVDPPAGFRPTIVRRATWRPKATCAPDRAPRRQSGIAEG